jgi:hypothetical protein
VAYQLPLDGQPPLPTAVHLRSTFGTPSASTVFSMVNVWPPTETTWTFQAVAVWVGTVSAGPSARAGSILASAAWSVADA